LDTGSGRVEILLEIVIRSPTLNDGDLEGPSRSSPPWPLLTRGGCKVLPEERMIDMACTDMIRDNDLEEPWLGERYLTHHHR
jgi:hypothetical protein